MRLSVLNRLANLWHRREPQAASFLRDRNKLAQQAEVVGADWKQHSNIASDYYDSAEQWMDEAWIHTIWSFIRDCDFSCIVDLAAGHGRNTSKLLGVATKLYVVDINEENIQFCRERFAGEKKIIYIRNDGFTLNGIANEEVTLVYCFDAMVHFDSDVVRSYLHDFYRVLKLGGHGFCHYSNYDKNPGGYYRDNPGWKNFMSENLFLHYCAKEGLQVIRSKVFDNGTTVQQDCLTLFQKPR